jgi:hypothetical protein
MAPLVQRTKLGCAQLVNLEGQDIGFTAEPAGTHRKWTGGMSIDGEVFAGLDLDLEPQPPDRRNFED